MSGDFTPFDQFDQDLKYPHKSSRTILDDMQDDFRGVMAVVAGVGIMVDSADPSNPIITATPYTLPQSTSTIRGGIKLGTGLVFNEDTDQVDATYTYTLPQASTSVLGGIKLGTALAFNEETGKVDATYTYTLPQATDAVLGGIKLGDNLVFNEGTGKVDVDLPNFDAVVDLDSTAVIKWGEQDATPVSILAADIPRLLGEPTVLPVMALGGLALGDGASAMFDSTVAVGEGATVGAANSVVVGGGASTTQVSNVIVGDSASSTAINNTVIGATASCADTESLVVGYGASASTFGGGGNSTVVIGPNASSDVKRSTVIGSWAKHAIGAGGNPGVVIGYSSSALASNSIVIGRMAYGGWVGVTVLGDGACAGTDVGGVPTTDSQFSVVIGQTANAQAKDALLMGRSTSVTANYGGAFGRNAKSYFENSYAFGYNSETFNVQEFARKDSSAHTRNLEVLRSATTTSATPVAMTGISIPDAGACLFRGRIVAYQTAGSGNVGDCGSWEVEGLMKMTSGILTLIGASVGSAGSPSRYQGAGTNWTAALSISGNALILTVTGEAGKTIKWSFTVNNTTTS